MLATYGPGRSRHRKTESDPGHPYVTPPYTIQWPAPAREPTRSASRSSSVERKGDPFVAQPGSLPATKYTETPPTVSPRSPSPQHPLTRSASRQGSVSSKAPQSPLIKDVPQPPRTAFNVPSAVTASQPYHPSSVQLQNSSLPGMHRHSARPQTPANVYHGRSTSATHLLNHHHHHQTSHHHHHPPPTTTHHVSHPPRSRSRPPSAASHRYASNVTPSVYGHGGPAAPNGSHSSLTGAVPSLKDYNASSPPPGMSSISYYHIGTAQAQITSGSPQRSRSHTRAPSPSPTQTMHPSHTEHKLEEPPRPQRTAQELRRNPRRPALPPNYDGQKETRYVNMLLAMDDISTLYNILAAFSTWVMLAGFVLLPATFASWKTQPAGTPQGVIARLINNNALLIIASLCTALGLGGMIALWWRWRSNYVWITQHVFIPGFLNSVAGVISTLSSVYGTQGGMFGETELSAIIVTGSLTLICGTLVVVYQYGLIRTLRFEHDEEVGGVELAGKHGEGVLVEKTGDQNGKL